MLALTLILCSGRISSSRHNAKYSMTSFVILGRIMLSVFSAKKRFISNHFPLLIGFDDYRSRVLDGVSAYWRKVTFQ